MEHEESTNCSFFLWECSGSAPLTNSNKKEIKNMFQIAKLFPQHNPSVDSAFVRRVYVPNQSTFPATLLNKHVSENTSPMSTHTHPYTPVLCAHLAADQPLACLSPTSRRPLHRRFSHCSQVTPLKSLFKSDIQDHSEWVNEKIAFGVSLKDSSWGNLSGQKVNY